MKRLLLAATLLPLLSTGQKIVENRVDDFTHHKIVRTNWEALVQKFGGHNIIHARMSRINDAIFLDYRFMYDGSVIAVDEGANLMIKTDGDSVVTLKNMRYQISCKGCGTTGFTGNGLQGLDLSFPLTGDQAHYLLLHKAVKVRIYTTDGYIEDEVKEKSAGILIGEIKLILQS